MEETNMNIFLKFFVIFLLLRALFSLYSQVIEIELYDDDGPTNILISNMGGRNGNGNFRLSGYVPDYGGSFYAKVFEQNSASGNYKVRFIGGRSLQELMTHEPDRTIAFSSGSEFLAKNDTIYRALYPENDIDYYRISARAGEKFKILTLPILDLDARDTDTYLLLFDSFGNLIIEVVLDKYRRISMILLCKLFRNSNLGDSC
jgi:hypothetical protein